MITEELKMKRNITPHIIRIAMLLSLSIFSAKGALLIKVDFNDGKVGVPVSSMKGVLATEYPATVITDVFSAGTFTVDNAGHLPGQFGLFSGKNISQGGGFIFAWADDQKGHQVKSGVLSIGWKMKVVSCTQGDIAFQVLRSRVAIKGGGRLARIVINLADGQIKMGGSTDEFSMADFPISKNRLDLSVEHTFAWMLDYSSGVQRLIVDDGSKFNYVSSSREVQNFHVASPATSLRVLISGTDPVLALDDLLVDTTEALKK